MEGYVKIVNKKEFVHPYYYHGTTTPGITELWAKPIVYLTPNRAYALFYIMDKNINWVTCGVREDGVVHYDGNFQISWKNYTVERVVLSIKAMMLSFYSGKSRGIVVSKSPIAITDYE